MGSNNTWNKTDGCNVLNGTVSFRIRKNLNDQQECQISRLVKLQLSYSNTASRSAEKLHLNQKLTEFEWFLFFGPTTHFIKYQFETEKELIKWPMHPIR